MDRFSISGKATAGGLTSPRPPNRKLCKSLATKHYFRHQEIDSLPLRSIQHAIMTLNNTSGAEIITAENFNHVQVSCSPKFMKAKSA